MLDNFQIELIRRRKKQQFIKMCIDDDNSPQETKSNLHFNQVDSNSSPVGNHSPYKGGREAGFDSQTEGYSRPNHSLELQDTEHAELKVGIQKNGKKYSVRTNRKRFFFPSEWKLFWGALQNPNQRRCFDILINTGARYNEAKNIKKEDIDFERGTLTIKVAKIKAKKGQRFPDPRTFKLSSQFLENLKGYTEHLKDNDTIPFLTNSALNLALKKILGKIGIKDKFMFSVHNLRKTHGNWLVAHDVNIANICKRLGHDYNTFLGSYASADIFDDKDRDEIKEILGDLINGR